MEEKTLSGAVRLLSILSSAIKINCYENTLTIKFKTETNVLLLSQLSD